MKVKYALVLSAVMLMVSMSSNASVLVRDTFYFKIYDATCQLRMAISDGYGNGVHSFAHMPGSACPGRSALMTTLTQVKKSRWHSFRTVAVYRGTGELYPNGAQGTRTCYYSSTKNKFRTMARAKIFGKYSSWMKGRSILLKCN